MTKPSTKHQIKSEATRAALLKAAETIFARDGFERAQIDEIARESGRTRGAVYAQFKTKEQLFFALQTQHIQKAARRVSDLISGVDQEDFAARLAILKSYYADQFHLEATLLDLEMKLYALHHPESVDELRECHKRTYPKGNFSKDFGILNEPGRSRVDSRVLALGAIKSGLSLAMQFQPDVLTPKEVRLLLAEIFDGLFPASSVKKSSRKKTKK